MQPRRATKDVRSLSCLESAVTEKGTERGNLKVNSDSEQAGTADQRFRKSFRLAKSFRSHTYENRPR
jgi:hypothetical protein